MQKLYHPLVIKFYEKIIHNQRVCFITELASCGNLENLGKE